MSAVADDPDSRVVSPADWIAFMAMVVGMFMAILDIQIVASSIAQIQSGIAASADEATWVQTSYLVAEVVMIPLSGWLARLLSLRLLFFISAVSFTVASGLCAMAWSIESMIVFRAVQGFLGGAMIPTVFTASFTLFPPSRQAGMSVLIGLVATMAPTLGPTLGGWLTESVSWHWLFLVNLLPGAVVAALVWSFGRREPVNRAMLKGFDLAGILLVALFLGTLQYVLEEGNRKDWLGDGLIATMVVVSAAAGLAFLWRELTAPHPVVDLRAFSDSNFAVGCFYSFVIGIGLYGSVYVVPLYLGQVRGYSALEIGVTMMVTGAFQCLSAPLAGALARVMDPRLMLGLGLGVGGGGLWVNSAITSDWGYWERFRPMAVRGLSVLYCYLPCNRVALGHLPPERVPNASGLYNLMRNLGGAVGLAVIATMLTRRLDHHMLRLSEALTAGRGIAVDTLAGLTAQLTPTMGAGAEAAALKILWRMTRREALTLAFADVLLLMAGVFVVGLLLLPLLQPVAKEAGGGDAH